MDKIKIKNLEIYARHGVYPEENALGQKFLISAVLYTRTRKSGMMDDLSQSVNYGEVCQFIAQFMEEHTFKLIETVAERLAQALLLKFPLVKKVKIEVKKPWAPIGLPLDTVSVEIVREWHKAYIALGSNLGDKAAYLTMGVRMLNAREDCQVLRISDFIITPPYGVVDQDDFLNGVLELKTTLTPEELLSCLHGIEQAANRERLIHWGPRTLDLDIIFYDNMVVDTPRLHIPHQEMHKRPFVLIPMAQIAPWVRHPILQKTVEQLLKEVTETEGMES